MKRFSRCYFLILLLMALLVAIVLVGIFCASVTPSAVAHQEHYSVHDLSDEIVNSSPCHGVSQSQKGAWHPVYIVVITAAESWTSVNSFAFHRCCLDNRFLLQNADYFTLDESIIDYARSSRKIRHLLQPLIDRAQKFVPSNVQKVTNILFRATPVLRDVVPKKEIHRLLLRARSVLRHSSFRMRSREVTIRTTSDEAADLWLSAVFLTGRIYRKNPSQLAVVDLSSGLLRVAIPVAVSTSSENIPTPMKDERSAAFNGVTKGKRKKNGKTNKQKQIKKKERIDLERKAKRESPPGAYFSIEQKGKFGKSITDSENISVEEIPEESKDSIINAFRRRILSVPKDEPLQSALEKTTNESLLSILRRKLIISQGRKTRKIINKSQSQSFANKFNPRSYQRSNNNTWRLLDNHTEGSTKNKYQKDSIVSKPEKKFTDIFNNIYNREHSRVLKLLQRKSLIYSRGQESFSQQIVNHNKAKSQDSYNAKEENMFLTPNAIKTNNPNKLKTMIELNTNGKNSPKFLSEDKFNSYNEKIKNISFTFTDFNYGPKGLSRCAERANENCKREDENQTKTDNLVNTITSKKYEEIIKNQPRSLNKFKRATKAERNGKMNELQPSLKTFKAVFWINCKKLNVFPKIVTLKRQLDQKSKFSAIKLENFGPGRCNSTDFGETIFLEKVNNFSVRKRRRNFLHIFLHDGKLNCDDTPYYFKNCFRESNNNAEIVKGKNWRNVNCDQVYKMLFTKGDGKKRTKPKKGKERKEIGEKRSKRRVMGGIEGVKSRTNRIRTYIKEEKSTKIDGINKKINVDNEIKEEGNKKTKKNLPIKIIIYLESEIKQKRKENNNKSKEFFFHAYKPSLKNAMAGKNLGKNEKFEDKFEDEQRVKKIERQSILSLLKVKRDIKSETKGFRGGKTMSSYSLGNNRTTTLKTKGRKKNRTKKIRVKRDSTREAKNDFRNKNFISNNVKNLSRKNEGFYFTSMFPEGKRFIRLENNLVFLFNPNKCIIPSTKNRTVLCRWEQSLILALRRNNLVFSSSSAIQFNRISTGLESKARIRNTVLMGGEAYSTQREAVVHGQRPAINIVDQWKRPRIKISEPIQSSGMMNVKRNESFDKVAFIHGLWRLPSRQLKYYLFAANIGANDPSKLPAEKFAKKVNSQSIRKIAFQTPNGENDRPTKNNQSGKMGENSDRPDVSGISSENNYLPDKEFWISTFSTRTPQNNNRNSKNRRQKIRKKVKKHKRETGSPERNQVNITSRCFAGNKIWLFATSYPLGIYPARVSVLLGANSSSSIERPSHFGSPQQPSPSSSRNNMMVRNKSEQQKRRSDVSPEEEYTVTSSQRASHPNGTLSFQPRGPGPPATSSFYTKAKTDSDQFSEPPDQTPSPQTESNEQFKEIQINRSETSEEVKYSEVGPKTRFPPLSDPHSKTSIWPKGTLENIKGVVDSILMAIGSSSPTSGTPPSSTVPPITTIALSVSSSHNDSSIPLERYKNQRREFSKERLKKTEGRGRKNSSSILVNKSLVRNVTGISGTNKTDHVDKIFHQKKYKRSLSDSLHEFNNSTINYNEYENSSDLSTRASTSNTTDKSINITEPNRRQFGTFSSVTDLLFTVPNLRVSNPEDNSQIDSEIKLTEKLIRSSLKDFLIFVPDSVLTEDGDNKTKEDSENIFQKLTFPIFRLDRHHAFSESSVENKRSDQIEPLTKPMEELILKSSCIPTGSLGRFTIDDVSYTVVGKGDKENGTKKCWEEVTKVIDKHFSIPSVKGMDFLASTAFYFIASKANLIDQESQFGYVKPIRFKSAADEMCDRDPENLPDPLACLDYQFLAAILLHGFELPEDKNIMVCEAVGDFRMNSALGAAVNFLQRHR